MATRRVTRYQSKKSLDSALGTHDKGAPRGRSCAKPKGTDENLHTSQHGANLRKSFPLDRDDHGGKTHYKKTSQTDTTTKKKRTLAERATNSCTEEKVAQSANKARGKLEANYTKCLPSPRPSTPWIIHNTSDRTLLAEDKRAEDIEEDEMDNDDGVEEILPGEETMISDNSSESPMEFQLRDDSRRPRQLPFGVVDIDFEADSLRTCDYAGEILTYLFSKEKDWILDASFLDKSPDVTPRMRAVLMDWLIQVQAHEELKEETLHLCVFLIDRFLGIVETRMPKLQLVGITCLLIASKFIERFAPEIPTLCHLTDNTFRPQQVIRYEILVLKNLNFPLLSPVCTVFLDRFLQVHEDEDPSQVGFLSRYLLDLSIISHHLATALPSVLAASALYLARRLVYNSSQAWSTALRYYTTYTESDLIGTVNELANMLLKAPSSKFQGSRSKYNIEQYAFISTSQLIQPERVINHFESPEGTVV